jgi:hypothetical protein
MRSKLCGLSVVTIAAIAGCSSSTGIRSCDANTTTASFREVASISETVTSITVTGQSKLVETAMMPGMSSGRMTFVVTDTTPVFERVGEGAPRASSACRLAVGEVVEIPFGDGFGDFPADAPPPTISQLVIER